MPTDASPRPYTLFTLGRGAHAYPLGAFHGTMLPEEVARFPIGRALLSASAPSEARDLFARFAMAWDIAGFNTFTRNLGHTTVPESTRIHWNDPAPEKYRCAIYAYDDGQWFHWLATDYPQWLRVNLAENGTVTERPVARVYGSEYARTQGLSLVPLAAWIMGAATEKIDCPDVAFCAAVDTGTATGQSSIHLSVHTGLIAGLSAIFAELDSIAWSCNWFNPCDPHDRRFDWCAPCIDIASDLQPGELVTVTDQLVDE